MSDRVLDWLGWYLLVTLTLCSVALWGMWAYVIVAHFPLGLAALPAGPLCYALSWCVYIIYTEELL